MNGGNFSLTKSWVKYDQQLNKFEPVQEPHVVFESAIAYSSQQNTFLHTPVDIRLSRFSAIKKKIIATPNGQRTILNIMVLRLMLGLSPFKYSNMVVDTDTEKVYSFNEIGIAKIDKDHMIRATRETKVFKDLSKTVCWEESLPPWCFGEKKALGRSLDAVSRIALSVQLLCEKLSRVLDNMVDIPYIIRSLRTGKTSRSKKKSKVKM